MDKRNPCDLCERTDCFDCALDYNSGEYQCCNWDCFLNHEGDCIISVFDNCGAWKKEG